MQEVAVVDNVATDDFIVVFQQVVRFCQFVENPFQYFLLTVILRLVDSVGFSFQCITVRNSPEVHGQLVEVVGTEEMCQSLIGTSVFGYFHHFGDIAQIIVIVEVSSCPLVHLIGAFSGSQDQLLGSVAGIRTGLIKGCIGNTCQQQ